MINEKICRSFAVGMLTVLTACNDKETTATSTTNSGSANDTVYLYTWTEYVPDGLLDEFTKETGIKVIVSSLESNETMYAKLKTQGELAVMMLLLHQTILFQKWLVSMLMPLDHSKLPVIKELIGLVGSRL